MNELEHYKQLVEELRGIKERRSNGVRERLLNAKAKKDAGLASANGPSWLVNNDGEWKLIPEKVLTVERIFAMAARGLSSGVIAGYLRDTQVPLLGWADEWTNSSINALIQNVNVLGHMKGRGDGIALQDHYPQIIDEEVFNLIQKHVKNKTGGAGSSTDGVPNLFGRLMKCKCGGPLRYVAGGKRLPAYVICRNVSDGTKSCDAEKIPYQPLEDQLMSWICEEHQFDMSVNRRVSYDPKRTLTEQLKVKEKALQLMQANVDSGKLNGSDFDAKFVKLADEVIELRSQIDALPLRFLKTGSEETKQLWDRHNAATGEMKVIYRLRLQAALRTIITEIQVSLYSKLYEDAMVRNLKLFGSVIKLLYANRTDVDEADKNAARRNFSEEGISFEVRWPLKA